MFQTVNAPQKNKTSFIRLLLHNSIIHHTYNVFFFLLNLRVIWQTCATVNVRYFPWGKLGWEGPGTLLAMGLPENKGGGGGVGWGAERALFIGVTVITPHSQVDSASPPLEPSVWLCPYTNILPHNTHACTESAAWRRIQLHWHSLQCLNTREIFQDRWLFLNTHTSLAILSQNTKLCGP